LQNLLQKGTQIIGIFSAATHLVCEEGVLCKMELQLEAACIVTCQAHIADVT
jgi:hypothetical protein